MLSCVWVWFETSVHGRRSPHSRATKMNTTYRQFFCLTVVPPQLKNVSARWNVSAGSWLHSEPAERARRDRLALKEWVGPTHPPPLPFPHQSVSQSWRFSRKFLGNRNYSTAGSSLVTCAVEWVDGQQCSRPHYLPQRFHEILPIFKSRCQSKCAQQAVPRSTIRKCKSVERPIVCAAPVVVKRSRETLISDSITYSLTGALSVFFYRGPESSPRPRKASSPRPTVSTV